MGAWAGRVPASLLFSTQPVAATVSSLLVSAGLILFQRRARGDDGGRERGEMMEAERDGSVGVDAELAKKIFWRQMWHLQLVALRMMAMAHWLQEYSVETAIATIVDGSDSLKINTQHLRELSFRVGSIYQFIGELLIQPDNEAVLQARVEC
ncbi:PREDICTED: CST complex subunit TEN1 [Prunus dulcis]|uniref:PREDICTED: CST complex subunit TEN1 n=1 Tax=Prunus dulcis TaxID=3755 RepID=A0A5E4FDY1_PRUDU|nr:PREDICTED: CST complex subunit TEN1 [Prunus dulcis]VVA41561.1 PREDICTED: CST complex subunit TEN1 [Prunus dulcis]